MLFTSSLFLIGMCIYIKEMGRDLRSTLAEFDDRISTERIVAEIVFHREIVKWIAQWQQNATSLWHIERLGSFKSIFIGTNCPPSLADLLEHLMSVGLFFQLLVCATSLAVYMVGIETNGVRSMNTCISIIGVLITMSSTYVYCLISENVTTDLEMVGDSFYESSWYRLPVQQQRLFGLPIQRSQKEFRMTGLGFVECSLRVYSSVWADFHYVSENYC